MVEDAVLDIEVRGHRTDLLDLSAGEVVGTLRRLGEFGLEVVVGEAECENFGGS